MSRRLRFRTILPVAEFVFAAVFGGFGLWERAAILNRPAFGAGQTLRVIVVLDDDRAAGIVPLVVRSERSKLGAFRVLTFPLHDWGSFYGPIGPDPGGTLRSYQISIKVDSCTPSGGAKGGTLTPNSPLTICCK